MIIEPLDDRGITALCKAPVGEIRLPGLIGLHRFKAGDVGLTTLLFEGKFSLSADEGTAKECVKLAPRYLHNLR